MKLLVTGSTGFVGLTLISALKNTSYQVYSSVRKVDSDSTQENVFSVGHIDADTNWREALSAIDVVIHLAARVHVMREINTDPLTAFRKVNVEGTLNLARQAVQAGVKRFIFMSSIKVNGEQTLLNQPFTASDIPNPQDAYAISKYEAEQGLLLLAKETGLEVVIIRPPLIYGAGVKANFSSMIRTIKRGIPLPLGAINNKRSLVYVGNLVSLIIKCINHPAAVNQIFLVSDGSDLSTTELLRACARSLEVKARLLCIPQRLLEIITAILGKQDLTQRLCGNLQVEISKTRTMLEWSPPISVEDGLKATAQALKDKERK